MIYNFGYAQVIDLKSIAADAAKAAASAAATANRIDTSAGGRAAELSRCINAGGLVALRSCRATVLRSAPNWPQLLSTTESLLESIEARYLVGFFFSQVIPACGAVRPLLLPPNWRETQANLRRLAPGEVHKLVKSADRFSAYKEELRDRLLLAAESETLFLAAELLGKLGAPRLIMSFMGGALSFEMPDCQLLSPLEVSLVVQIASTIEPER